MHLQQCSYSLFVTQESTVQVKDENEHNGEPGSFEAIPKDFQRGNCGSSGVKSKWSQPISGIEVASSKASKHVKVSHDAIAFPETMEVRKTPKKLVSKVRCDISLSSSQ